MTVAVKPAPRPALAFPVYFEESGLPDNGSEWRVTVSGIERLNVTPVNTTIFWLPNGTYEFTTGGHDLETNQSLETLVVTGGPVYEKITFYDAGFLSAFDARISHIVVIFMENHAYDNYFAGYCLQLGPYCNDTANGVPTGTCVPQLNASGGCVRTFNYTTANDSTFNPAHYYQSTVDSIDGGRMNGFYSAEGVKGNMLTVFGHYNASTIPVYWDMAQEFGLGDDVYSSDLSYSLPNHWYLVAGQAPSPFQTVSLTYANRFEYLNAANKTETIQDLLNLTPTVTWKYYQAGLGNYKGAISVANATAFNRRRPRPRLRCLESLRGSGGKLHPVVLKPFRRERPNLYGHQEQQPAGPFMGHPWHERLGPSARQCHARGEFRIERSGCAGPIAVLGQHDHLSDVGRLRRLLR